LFLDEESGEDGSEGEDTDGESDWATVEELEDGDWETGEESADGETNDDEEESDEESSDESSGD
jgi:hypothetical protein